MLLLQELYNFISENFTRKGDKIVSKLEQFCLSKYVFKPIFDSIHLISMKRP